MTYEEYRKKSQKEFDELPLFFAFSDKQFGEEMEKRGLTIKDTDKVYRFGKTGGFYLKSDAQIIRDYMNKEDDLPALMKDYNFAVSAFEYEMRNHEYAINLQADWDVCSCFVHCKYDDAKSYIDYFEEAGHSEWIEAYAEARNNYYKMARENEWF